EVGLGIAASIVVSVFQSPPLDGELFDNTNLTWTSDGNTPWFGQSFITHASPSAAQSGAIGDGQESWLETSLVGPGPLTFWWKISSGTDDDFLEFYINDELQSYRISGEIDRE